MRFEKKDILAPANFISLAGVLMVGAGLREGIDTPKGAALIGVGRGLDLLDGPIARHTHSSEFGAAVDAIFDKGGIFAILVQEYKKDMLPRGVAAGVGIQNAVNIAATYAAKRKHPGEELETAITGKRSMFSQSAGLGLFAVSTIVKERYPKVSRALYHTAIGEANTGTYPYGAPATRLYINRAK